METVYIESTIPSYLTARQTAREPMASHQKSTKDWWNHERERFRLYSSIAVRAEISKGDASAVAKRLKVMAGIPELEILPELQPLAESIVHLLQLPPKARLDATHLAFSVVHRIDYLLTWNCTHLANASLQKTLFEYCSYHHLHMPVICTSRSSYQSPAMKDIIVQEVREARASLAADFDCDLGKFFAWAKAHTAAERKAKHPLPTEPARLPKQSGQPKTAPRKRVQPSDATA